MYGCCRDRRDTIRKIVDVLSLTIFNQTPTTPIPSRWSKVTVTIIWFYKGFALHNILSKVFDWCFNPHGHRLYPGGLVVSEVVDLIASTGIEYLGKTAKSVKEIILVTLPNVFDVAKDAIETRLQMQK